MNNQTATVLTESKESVLPVGKVTLQPAKLTNKQMGVGVVVGAPSCFLAGSMVTMIDGTVKKIEDVKIGDFLKGAFGEKNQVLALDRPLLGNRLMYQINNDHHTTSEHPHVSWDKQLYCLDVDAIAAEWNNPVEVILADGSKEMIINKGVSLDRINQLKAGIMLQTVNGERPVDSITSYELPATTQLYNFVMSGSHTYFVDGYAVTGWPREDDFNYDTWTKIDKSVLLNDYIKQLEIEFA